MWCRCWLMSGVSVCVCMVVRLCWLFGMMCNCVLGSCLSRCWLVVIGLIGLLLFYSSSVGCVIWLMF